MNTAFIREYFAKEAKRMSVADWLHRQADEALNMWGYYSDIAWDCMMDGDDKGEDLADLQSDRWKTAYYTLLEINR